MDGIGTRTNLGPFTRRNISRILLVFCFVAYSFGQQPGLDIPVISRAGLPRHQLPRARTYCQNIADPARMIRPAMRNFLTERCVIWNVTDASHGRGYLLPETSARWFCNLGPFGCNDPSTTRFQTSGRGGFVPLTPPGTYTPNGQSCRSARRKEYRMMTRGERNRFHRAMRAMKQQRIDGLPKYDVFILLHTNLSAPPAHFGPAFLPWHREYIFRFETALREIDCTVSLPYWDARLDAGLPNPVDSVIWTDEFFGTSNGRVNSGPYAGWEVPVDIDNWGNRLFRNVESRPGFLNLYNRGIVQHFMSKRSYREHTWAVDGVFEATHGGMHNFIGGHMSDLEFSPCEPAFWLLHSAIDHYWDIWRRNFQQGNPQTEYAGPRDYVTSFHAPDAHMRPMGPPTLNHHGLSNVYAWYGSYEPLPTCSPQNPVCGSGEWIFCNRRVGFECASRIRDGGLCTGVEDGCLRGRSCCNGLCVRGNCNPTGFFNQFPNNGQNSFFSSFPMNRPMFQTNGPFQESPGPFFNGPQFQRPPMQGPFFDFFRRKK